VLSKPFTRDPDEASRGSLVIQSSIAGSPERPRPSLPPGLKIMSEADKETSVSGKEGAPLSKKCKGDLSLWQEAVACITLVRRKLFVHHEAVARFGWVPGSVRVAPVQMHAGVSKNQARV
jgi:hypothetical protein